MEQMQPVYPRYCATRSISIFIHRVATNIIIGEIVEKARDTLKIYVKFDTPAQLYTCNGSGRQQLLYEDILCEFCASSPTTKRTI